MKRGKERFVDTDTKTVPRILVVDDEHTITDLVGIYLQNEGYEVTLAYNGADAAREILTHEFDLAILDIMLPDIDGFELLRTIRANRTYPVIMLTARDAQADKIEGLSLGADDYVVKPFRPLELVARVKAQLRRYTSYGTRDQTEDSLLSVNGLTINRDARQVTVDEKPVRTTPLEYAILLYLVEHRGKVVPVEELFRAVWNEEFMAGSNNTVMVHIRHLREKIGDDAQNPRFIRNIWGVGYTIDA
ncbi:DNA-binding response regulator [Collinsella sp. An7]|nr:DNA-binding response regulator [Collinsella sp. An7]